MQRRKKTVEEYKHIGARFRALKMLASQTSVEAAKFIPKHEWRKLQNAIDTIGTYSSMIEDRMFRDYPELPDTYNSVFYGGLYGEPRNDVDAEIMKEARKMYPEDEH